MTSPKQEFNTLERAILDWLKEGYTCETLKAQVDAATFEERDWTNVGYYVYFDVPQDLTPLNLDELGGTWPIPGPFIISQDIDVGAYTQIWGGDGYIGGIEMVGVGKYFNEEVSSFELENTDRRK